MLEQIPNLVTGDRFAVLRMGKRSKSAVKAKRSRRCAPRRGSGIAERRFAFDTRSCRWVNFMETRAAVVFADLSLKVSRTSRILLLALWVSRQSSRICFLGIIALRGWRGDNVRHLELLRLPLVLGVHKSCAIVFLLFQSR